MPLDPRVAQALAAFARASPADAPPTVLECDEALADTAAFCAAYGHPESTAANCILVASREAEPRFAACVVLATSRLDVNGVVRKKLGAKRVSFASADQTEALTGMRIGGVTPFGLPAGLPLWVDARIPDCPYVIVGGGSRTAKLQLAPLDLLRLPGAELVPGLGRATADPDPS